MDRNIKERGHDPYAEARKYPEGAYCPECGAVYRQGRWIWSDVPVRLGNPVLCGACKRVRDAFPAGEVRLSGSYVKKHKDEILNLINKTVGQATSRSPLKRLMDIEEAEGNLVVRLTDDHLARRVAHAVHRAFKGDLRVRYSLEERFVRLQWQREM
ncbi:MAG TPA: BCAM0308 family protein [Deltaproteobacteria bacterium]|nr:BCAM0308 family protein [Deltaproteobacteria bacterium]